jgi:Putative adhesin
MGAFWQTWRKEIIRGVALFCGVLCLWLLGSYFVRRVHEGVTRRLPMALRDLRNELDAGSDAGPRIAGATWSYRAKVAPKQWVWIRNTRGSVTVEAAKGDFVEISAAKSYRSSDTSSVRLVAEPYAGGVAVCALWAGGDQQCGPEDHGYEMHGPHRNDVIVDFTVRLPNNVRLGASTMVGDVRVTGARAPLVLHTVSGDVDAVTAQGPVKATSMNGGVRVRIDAFGDTGAVTLKTINGSVTAELPPRLDAQVSAKTINGSIATDYGLTVNGKFMSHDIEGTLGRGGREVSLETVNGSIHLHKASQDPR